MRKSADWMTIWDDRILEVIREEGPSSPTPLSEHEYIHINPSSVSRRLRKLNEAGLVQALGNGVYSLTPNGESYLEGELNAEELKRDGENGDETAQAS